MRRTTKPSPGHHADRPLKGALGTKSVTRKSAIPIPKLPWKPTHTTVSEIRRALRETMRGRLAVDA
jgi:hypothetical protein